MADRPAVHAAIVPFVGGGGGKEVSFWTRLRERWVNFYPPMLGAGIRSHYVDERTIDVEMKLTAFNRNIVGVHFGGSLYAMCDPWFMLILMRALGGDYIVWDKAASIRFVSPGRGTVRAHFHIPQSRVDEIRAAADRDGKVEPTFSVDVLDAQGKVVAQVEKLLYVRRKNKP
ncbi:MAG: YiiD C-terminal domain-containing protein [Chloroflexi bacterium]|nr:YiiD C-terminal domain-containing protein [Chloroflexota bacterium]